MEEYTKNLFPALEEYHDNHCEHNLKKLCLQIQEFCTAVYATLQTEGEKDVYKQMASMIGKVVKK